MHGIKTQQRPGRGREEPVRFLVKEYSWQNEEVKEPEGEASVTDLIMIPERCPCLIPRTCEHVMLY